MDHEIFANLKRLMLTFMDISPEQITPDTQFSTLRLESLDFVEIQVELEKLYGVKVESTLFSQGRMTTVGELARYVAGQTYAKAA